MEKEAKKIIEGKDDSDDDDPIKAAFKKQSQQMALLIEAINNGVRGGSNQQKTQPIFKNGKRVPPPLAVLPVHLIPKALGGEGGEDIQVDEAANKKNKQTTFKKRKNKEQMLEEAQKAEEDAQFLEELFQDNLSEDTNRQNEIRYQQY